MFGLLWQCFGAAISLPLFYSLHLEWNRRASITRAEDVETARFLPLGFVLGAVVPVVVGMAPTWLGPGVRTAEAHQVILAAWQLDPVWVSWILQGTVFAGTWFIGRSADAPEDRRKAYWWVCFSFLLAALLSALGHIYVVSGIISSHREDTSFTRMYVPFPFVGPMETEENILVRGPWLFLQYDFIIISSSSLSWAYLLLRHSLLGQRSSQAILVLTLVAGTITVGPGATVSLALLVRESQLSEYY